MKKWITNPVLTGFHPDPCICRKGEDYYIATSTFQWFPGVEIYHSKDLVNWEFVGRPLDETRLLDMNGVPDSGGVWAPCLSYSDGLFYLVYSNVYTFTNYYKDVDNFLTVSESINGPWSDPVYLNSSGFDASMFHDTDGKKYLVNQIWDHRFKDNAFYGIALQEYDVNKKKLVGNPVNIFKGSSLGSTEAPHLYKINGKYYLLCAEGGTFYEHAATLTRADRITGPYEVSPYHPLLTSYGHPELVLQKSGHGSIIETHTGEWYMAHLCARPLNNGNRCMLGRETAIQKLKLTSDGWFCTDDETGMPKEKVEPPDLPEFQVKEIPVRKTFPGKLPDEFQSLRVPLTKEWMDFNIEKERLILYGKESMESLHMQSLVARRREHFVFQAETKMYFNPQNYGQMAGFALYYDTTNYFYLCVSMDESIGKCIYLLECCHGVKNISGEMVKIPNEQDGIVLRMEVNNSEAEFYCFLNGKKEKIGTTMDATQLSDDFYEENKHGLRFTGTFVALCCQDVRGTKKAAEFEYFEYKPGEM